MLQNTQKTQMDQRTKSKQAVEQEIAEFICNLGKLEKPALVELKRSFGKGYTDVSARAKMRFVSTLPNTSVSAKYKWFFIATLYAYLDGEVGDVTLAKAIRSISSTTTERVFESILDDVLEFDSLIFGKVSRLIKMLSGGNLKLDLSALLRDLVYWNSDSRSVQEKWIVEYYTQETDNENIEENEEK